MAATAFTSPAALTQSGFPSTAAGALSGAQLQAACDRANATLDAFLRGRYAYPLLGWGAEVSAFATDLAQYFALAVRGYNPAGGADALIAQRYKDAMTWGASVQSKSIHPDITPAENQSPTYDQPIAISSSVVDSQGRVDSNRGW